MGMEGGASEMGFWSAVLWRDEDRKQLRQGSLETHYAVACRGRQLRISLSLPAFWRGRGG